MSTKYIGVILRNLITSRYSIKYQLIQSDVLFVHPIWFQQYLGLFLCERVHVPQNIFIHSLWSWRHTLIQNVFDTETQYFHVLFVHFHPPHMLCRQYSIKQIESIQTSTINTS